MSILGESLILCERVLHDSQTQSISTIGCIDTIQSLTFPAQHFHFAVSARMRCDGPPPAVDLLVEYRVVRFSDADEETEVALLHGEWGAGKRSARVWVTFQFLRLFRPEVVWFRLDHRIGDGAWIEGPMSSVDVTQVHLTQEQEAELKALITAERTATTDAE